MYLLDEQPIYFQKIMDNQQLQEYLEGAKLTLIAFFEYNYINKDSQKYLY